MSTFEALKLAYLRSTGKDEPGVLALLAFGSISGSVGATSVYPLNLVRTRLQASGSPGHPQRYTGVWDVTVQTWGEGMVGEGFTVVCSPHWPRWVTEMDCTPITLGINDQRGKTRILRLWYWSLARLFRLCQYRMWFMSTVNESECCAKKAACWIYHFSLHVM